MVFGVVMFLFCFVVCVWFRFFVGGGRTGRNSIHWCVCVWFFFVFGRNVLNVETGCDERETRTDFSIGRSNNNDGDDDDNNINNSSNKKENALLCVCVLWNEKMVPFFWVWKSLGKNPGRADDVEFRPSRRRSRR